MSQFWPTFLGGVAAGILVLILGLFIRSLVRSRRSQGEAVLKLSTRQLGPIVVVAAGCIVVVSALLLRQGESHFINTIAVVFGVVIMMGGAALMQGK